MALSMASKKAVEQDVSALERLAREELPPEHPVARFDALYDNALRGALLPHERDVFADERVVELFPWVKVIEPVEVDGRVDFKIIRSGDAADLGEVPNQPTWLRDTVDPEFFASCQSEAMSVSILRKPFYSRGRAPSRDRSFLYLMRGVFPLFADTRIRMILVLVAAPPYARVTA